MAIATSQITIIDYNDSLSLTGFITSNHPKTQMYNPDNGSYNPNWDATTTPPGVNLVLTPSLYKMGVTSTDIITDAAITAVKWYEATAPTVQLVANTTYGISGAKNHILTVKSNVLAGLPSKDWICEVTYRDSTLAMDLTYKMSISISRVVNGGGIADAVVWAPKGNVFKNGTVTSLTAQTDLWRGSVIDTTSVTYQWYKQDSSVVTDQGGGVGWFKCIETANLTTGVTTNTITIFNSAVSSFAVFKCLIKDTDSGSNTYNQTFQDTISFIDNSDPIQMTVLSSGGEVFKNGVGSSTLTAKVFQAGAEIDVPGTKYTYSWSKYKSDGTLDTNWGTAGKKSGKSITVGDIDVDVKATFVAEIS